MILFFVKLRILYCHTPQLIIAVHMSLTKQTVQKVLLFIGTAEAQKHYLIDATPSRLSYSI